MSQDEKPEVSKETEITPASTPAEEIPEAVLDDVAGGRRIIVRVAPDNEV